MEKTYFLETKEQFEAVRFEWSEYIRNGGKPTAAQLIFYNVLRSKDPLHGFSPIKSKKKLMNGLDKWFGTKLSLNKINYICKWGRNNLNDLKEPFGNTIADEDILKTWETIKNLASELK